MISDLFSLSLNNLIHRKKRTFLTIIGIFIGITAVVALVSLGQGLSVAINKQFQEIGKDKLFVIPGSSLSATSSLTSATLTEDDVAEVLRVQGIAAATGVVVKSTLVSFGGGEESRDATVLGIATDKNSRLIEEVYDLKPVSGRLFESGDKFRCIIGESISKEGKFFKKPVAVGNTLVLNGKSFKVVGVTKSSGDPFTDQGIFIPVETAKSLFGVENYFRIVARVESSFEPKQVIGVVKEKLRKFRNVEKGEEDFNVLTYEDIVGAFNSIFSIVQAVVVGIAGISLLVGGIGIMNTMYTAVLERTREIGIMKAVGATDNDIVLLFLLESGFLGIVGGLLGVSAGFGLGILVELIASNFFGNMLLMAVFPIELVTGALAFSFLVGIISGALPAVQAAKLKPIETLRYE